MRGANVRFAVRAPAKVNLHLRVLGRRPDGYHELRTLFVAVGIVDDLEFEATRGSTIELVIDPPGVVSDGLDNLVVRAGLALADRFGVAAGARITLRKRIPLAGGMGGGSSDAAAALVGLSAAWALPAGFAELWPLAAELGADVPFFLVGGAAWGVGTGTEVFPLPDLPPYWLVISPGTEAVPTPAVYQTLGAAPLHVAGSDSVYHSIVTGGELPLDACVNDLEAAVLTGWPEVAARLDRIRTSGAVMARVSGSGGTAFGLFDDELGAREAAALLAGDGAVAVPLLGRKASSPVARIVEE